MKRFAHRLFLVLIMLWLPLQGTLAIAIQPCTHEENIDNILNSDNITVINDQQYTIDQKEIISSNTMSDQGCMVDVLCHINCSTCIPSTRLDAPTSNHNSNILAITAKLILFIPEQFERPPLV